MRTTSPRSRHESSGKGVYLSPIVAGKTHAKKSAEEAQVNATLDKDTGFQGYEPTSVITR
jgi:hypothetical protein